MQAAGLRPLAGSPAAIEVLLVDWLAAAEAPAISVRTSGSSGEPKEVLLSRAAVVASATAATSRLGGPGQWLLALPPHYVAGMQVIVRSLRAGFSPVALAAHEDLTAALQAMRGERHYVSLVPTQLRRMLASPADAEALATFDAVLLGGSAAMPGLLADARSRGVRVVTTYGMSETCGGCVYDGYPLDGVSVDVGPDGRVFVAGAVLFDGYAGRPDLTVEVLHDGRLRTPDLGALDREGRLTILGRADDVVVSGGVKVPVAAVERRLVEHPAVAAAAVLGVPDADWGARVIAVVVPQAGAEIGLAQLRQFVADQHPREWAPRELVLVETLPMLESGKLDRQALRAEVAVKAHG